MPRCSSTGHLAAATPIAAYLNLPSSDGRFTGDRYRLRLCTRHGHALLVLLMKRGANLLAEQELPDFCLGCAQPTSTEVFEARWYEGDWSLVASFSLCEGCGPQALDVLVDGPVSAEKMPPREKTPPDKRRRR